MYDGHFGCIALRGIVGDTEQFVAPNDFGKQCVSGIPTYATMRHSRNDAVDVQRSCS